MAGGLMAVVGGWLLVSPWIVGYRGEDPAWSAVACGAALIALALARTAAATLAVGMSLLGAAIGMWTFAGAFWLYDTTGGAWNAVVTGTVVIVLGMWSATAVDAPLGAGITDRATAAQRRHRWQ